MSLRPAPVSAASAAIGANSANSAVTAASPVTAEAESDQVFASAAELFKLMATPIRLKIISALCGQEKNVSQLLHEIDTTQPNMSQHLAALYRAGVVAKRRDATQIYYRIGSDRAASLCRAVCMQIALELEGDDMPPDQRLTAPPLARR